MITTVFTGSTERKAVDWLVEPGAQVKVSYDTQSTQCDDQTSQGT